MKKIICAHLFNDFSGSPLVLSIAIKKFVQEGMEVDIITSSDTEGFLTGMNGVNYRYIKYRFAQNKIVRLIRLMTAQLAMFFLVLKSRKEDVTIYVNTLLPFGAALAGKLLGKKVIYHIHETTVQPAILKSILKKTATICATEVIYVSHFLKEAEPLAGVPSRVVYNCLSKDFVDKAKHYLSKQPQKNEPFTLLMLCSLKEYKGVHEYVQLACSLPLCRFVLVLNSSFEAIQSFFEGHQLPDNLIVFPTQKEVHSFYQEAHLVVNLSHPEKWVETFGMTLLEAMSYGLPVIAPPVGGPDELVQDGYNGFKIDQRASAILTDKIRAIFQSPSTYRHLSSNAKAFAGKFSEEEFGGKILATVG